MLAFRFCVSYVLVLFGFKKEIWIRVMDYFFSLNESLLDRDEVVIIFHCSNFFYRGC